MNVDVPERDVAKLTRALEYVLDRSDLVWLGAGYRRVLEDLHRRLLRAKPINQSVSTKE